jgi:A/G-specific adenine glycosylase
LSVAEASRAAASRALAPALLAWFDRAGRKHLPWQRETTPYRVWVSEIMLQQTQVKTVIPYYRRFLEQFPTLGALASAPIDEVLHLWTGLGYYARARNLHRTAQLLAAEHGGDFPATLAEVQALPGIGRSTAGAILALSRHERHPILDGNVKRVLTRYFGIEGFPGLPPIERELWQLADACTPEVRVAAYTQAIMDLGATVCSRSKPACSACPIQTHCVAYRDGRQAELPTRRPARSRPRRTACVILLQRPDGALLLEQRPAAGIWGGLWMFPQFETRPAADAWMVERSIDSTRLGSEPLPPYFHSFTHFDLELEPLLVSHDPRAAIADEPSYRWYDPGRPPRIGLAKPAVDLIRVMAQRHLRNAV